MAPARGAIAPCCTPSGWSWNVTSSRRLSPRRPSPIASPRWALPRPREPRRPVAEIPESAISERFLAGSGPGGQNVNKVATACQLRVDVYALGLAPDAWRRLKALAGSRVTADGELIILARRFRPPEGKRADARARLSDLIDAALKIGRAACRDRVCQDV